MEEIGRKSGTVYREKVYVHGRPITKTFKRKIDARAWKTRTLAHVENSGAPKHLIYRKAKFGEIASDWYERKIAPTRAPKTAQEIRNALGAHFKHLEHKALADIGSQDADHFVSRLQKMNRASRTINRLMGLFKQILGFAEREGYILKSPLTGYQKLPCPESGIEYLHPEEIEKLLSSLQGDPIYGVVLVALNTGMRLGEITGLCWDKISFRNGMIEVARTLGRYGLRETTKTNRIRYVSMNGVVEDHLRKLAENRSSRFVFVDVDGEPFATNHFCSRRFRKALDRAEVRQIRFHGTRHTFASQYMMAGGNLFDLQKILGHTDTKQTMRYAHLSSMHMRKVSEVISFAPRPVSPQIAHAAISETTKSCEVLAAKGEF